MRWTAVLACCLLAAVASSTSAGQESINDTLVNKMVTRNIDLTSQLSKVTVEVEIENTGSSNVGSMHIALPACQAKHLATFDAYSVLRKEAEEKEEKEETDEENEDEENENNDDEEENDTVETAVSTAAKVNVSTDRSDVVFYRVDFAAPLAAGASAEYKVVLVFTRTMTATPASITQAENQLVKYFDNHFFFTPYKTTEQKTEVQLASATVEHHSEQPPTEANGDVISYGPYEDIPEFTINEMAVHFENNTPFVAVISNVREIEVSHWGNVSVEEHVHVRHEGAKLKGGFNRQEYTRSQGAGAAVPSLTAHIPEFSSDMYFRDEIGNITSSAIIHQEGEIDLELTPRFPLFGGWQSMFYFGYNLPIEQYLFTKGGSYMLNITFGPTWNDMVVDELTVKVILPEGSKNIQYESESEIAEQRWEVRHSFLDTQGRPVLVLVRRNVVGADNKYFQVTYDFASTTIWSEPLLVIGAFFALFVAYMVYLRLDFSISKTGNAEDESKIRDVILLLLDIQGQRDGHYTSLDKAYSAFKSGASYKELYAKAETGLRKSAGDLKKLTETSGLSNESIQKIRNVEAKEAEKQAAIVALFTAKAPSDAARLEELYEDCHDQVRALVQELTRF